MARITEALDAAKTKLDADATGKILLEHSREIVRLFALHGVRSNIEFQTAQLLKERGHFPI